MKKLKKTYIIISINVLFVLLLVAGNIIILDRRHKAFLARQNINRCLAIIELYGMKSDELMLDYAIVEYWFSKDTLPKSEQYAAITTLNSIKKYRGTIPKAEPDELYPSYIIHKQADLILEEAANTSFCDFKTSKMQNLIDYFF